MLSLPDSLCGVFGFKLFVAIVVSCFVLNWVVSGLFIKGFALAFFLAAACLSSTGVGVLSAYAALRVLEIAGTGIAVLPKLQELLELHRN